MTVRRRTTRIVPIVWPDGRVIGMMFCIGRTWYGPFVTVEATRLA